MVRSYIHSCAVAVVAIGLAGGSAGASAGTAAPSGVTTEAAVTLTDALETGLHQWTPASGGHSDYQWDGHVLVATAGDHFDVDLPSLRVLGAGGGRLDVGVIKLALSPNPDGSWGVGLTLPAAMPILNADGSPAGDVTIGAQHFFGQWLPAAGTFVKIDGSYGDLKAASRKDGSRFDIGNITIRTDLTELPPERWSGPSTLVVNKLTAADEHGVQILQLGSLAMEGTIASMDLARMVRLETQAQTAPAVQPAPAAEAAPGAGASPAATTAQAAVAQTTRQHLELLRGLFAGVSGKIRLNDLSGTTAAQDTSFTIGQMIIHGGIEGLDGDKSAVTIGYDQDGLKIKPEVTPQGLLPEKTAFRISLVDLPNAALWSLLERWATSITSDPKLMTQLSQQLVAALTQAGSRLRIETLHLETPTLSASLQGEAHLDPKAAMGGVAGVDMVVSGLENAATQVQPAPGAKPDPETQNLLMGLAMLQAFGAPGKDADGHDVRTYNLQLASDGKLLLNGADMSAVLQASQPHKGNGGGTGAGTAPEKP